MQFGLGVFLWHFCDCRPGWLMDGVLVAAPHNAKSITKIGYSKMSASSREKCGSTRWYVAL